MNDLKVGVIGVGALGRHHARILAGIEGVNLIGVADSSETRGREAAESWGCKWYADYREMLPHVDAVSIAVPTFAHLDVAKECVAHHLPMMMEKPLAGNVNDARQIAELADEKGITLQVGHVERFNPATLAAEPLCQNPKYIKSERLSSFSFRSTDISIVHDLMIHDLDLILSLVQSELKNVQAFGISLFGKQEDAVQARLEFENGCIADVSASRINPTAGRAMQVWSESGCTTIDFTTREVKQYSPGAELLAGESPVELAFQSGADIAQLRDDVFGRFITVTDADVSDDDALTAELTHFVKCVKTNSTPLVNGWTAVAALEIADEIQKAVASHVWGSGPQSLMGPRILKQNHDDQQKAA
ncbi:Gfo/Idh/MocA family oxidoreductase [Planctomycetaceae bacterium]|nr:Gfo/Idh/MocA family oxidoreductase [Planctomycetaceae bacterium]MDC0261908.1 Gfo/Idh/MocA family oxidoreductase [Planctomycetaceae bacterium]